MGRRKIKIKQIENLRQKNITMNRRRAGLVKKAHELSVLCEAKVLVVVFDPKNECHAYSSDDPQMLLDKYFERRRSNNPIRISTRDDFGEEADDDSNESVTTDVPISSLLNMKYANEMQGYYPGTILQPQLPSIESSKDLFISPISPRRRTLSDDGSLKQFASSTSESKNQVDPMMSTYTSRGLDESFEKFHFDFSGKNM